MADGKVRHRCRYERQDDGRTVDAGELWQEFETWPERLEAGDGNPFLMVSLQYAMEEKRSLHLHGQASRRLLANLTEFRDGWCRQKPSRYSRSDFMADQVVDDAAEHPGPGAVVLFSGGMDAAFTTWRHVKGLAGTGNQDIRLGVFIDGFERVAADDHENFLRVIPRVKRLLADLGRPLAVVRTNHRQMQKKEFEALPTRIYSPELAACLYNFKAIGGTGLIASSYQYSNQGALGDGSNPVSDRLLETGTFRIVHDAGGVRRVEKLAALIDWPAFHEEIRVCWYPRADGSNCGRCEKCLRTMLSYLVVAGRLPQGLPQDLGALRQAVREVKVKPKIAFAWQEIADWGREHGRDNEWIALLEAKAHKRWKDRRHELREWIKDIFR